MAEVLKPERRSAFDKIFSLFNMVGQGAQSWSNIKEGFGIGGAGGAVSGGGGGGGGFGLGVGGVKSVTEGMSPTLGGSEPAATGASEGISAYAPYAAPVIAGIDEYRYQEKKRRGEVPDQGTGRYAIGQGAKSQSQQMSTTGQFYKAGKDIGAEAQRFGKRVGLGLTDQGNLDAMERRYQTQQTAMNDIQEAQKALEGAGLPTDERRSISQKLEQARQRIGGAKRGGSLYTSKA